MSFGSRSVIQGFLERQKIVFEPSRFWLWVAGIHRQPIFAKPSARAPLFPISLSIGGLEDL